MHQQIEGDVWLEFGESAANRTQVVPHPELVHLVPQLLERDDHVPLRAEVGRLHLGKGRDVLGGHEVLVHQNQNFELLPHRGKWWCPRFRYLRVCTARRRIASRLVCGAARVTVSLSSSVRRMISE